MLLDHKLTLELGKINNKERWFFNIIFNMLDLFDKKGRVREIKLEDMLSKNRFGELAYCVKIGSKEVFTNYEMTIDKELAYDCYLDQVEDDTILINYVEIIALHEIAHIRYRCHSKRFYRHWKQLIYRWLAYKLNTTANKLKKSEPKLGKMVYMYKL